MPERKIRMDTQEILLQFKNGQMSLEEAEGYLKRQPFEEMAMPNWIPTESCVPGLRR